MYIVHNGGVIMDLVRIRYMKEWISQLPSGNITYKTINGKKYPYYQWTEKGKQRSRVVKADEFDELSEKISQRKTLEKKIAESGISNSNPEVLEDSHFFSQVVLGKDLEEFVLPVKQYKRRECYSKLHDYIYGNSTDRVFVLYGLRRTGKTTLIRQIIADMPEEVLMDSAFIQINPSIDLAKINIDLKQLSKQGYKYIFIDEVTLMNDFIESAALFSDIYASSGMKIVLSGTDSLGFVFSEDSSLYDRCYMLHTTFVPYREFSNVLDIEGIDNYIHYGGTMSIGGNNYNLSNTTFYDKKKTDEYIDSAIASNIQHSLSNYQHGGHFRSLSELHEAGELTSAINRIIERENKKFTVDTLIRDFESTDFGRTANNLLNDSQNPSDVLMIVDKEQITEWFMNELDILNKPEMKVEITEAHVQQIKEYLAILDLIVDIDVVSMHDLSKKEQQTVVSQPGMRYAQAKALIDALSKDLVFSTLSLSERNRVTDRMLSTIQGQLMEDIVLLETKLARTDCEVFKLKFAVGEFDMVVYNPTSASCEIFEVKHSKEIHPKQYQHLVDSEKQEKTSFRYGDITRRCVIYRGESKTVDGIQYLNVEEYLCSLGNK